MSFRKENVKRDGLVDCGREGVVVDGWMLGVGIVRGG